MKAKNIRIMKCQDSKLFYLRTHFLWWSDVIDDVTLETIYFESKEEAENYARNKLTNNSDKIIKEFNI